MAEARARRLAGIPWGDGTRDLAEDEEGFLDAPLGRKLAVCAACGVGELEHFYRSRRDGRRVCASCFAQRVERGLVRKVAAGGS